MAFTVTATQGGSTSATIDLAVRVVTGASGAGVIASATQTGTSLAITPGTTGSWVYGAQIAASGGGLYTPLGTTTYTDNRQAGGLTLGTFRSTSTSTGGTPETLGSSTNTSGISICLLEVKPSTSLAEDSSTPAVVQSGGTSATTASFSPPNGALLVAQVASNGGGSVTTMSVTDTSGLGLVWTQQVHQANTGNGYTGIFTAQMPALATPVAPQPIPPGFISPASVFFTWRPVRAGSHDARDSFTGAAAASGSPVRGVHADVQLFYFPGLPGPVVRPISFASPNPQVPLAAPAAVAGQAAATGSHSDPVTGRAAVSSVFAGVKTANGALSGPSAVSGVASGIPVGPGSIAGPVAASGKARGTKSGTGAFTGAAAATGGASGSPPVGSPFKAPAAVTGLISGGPPVPPPVPAAPALVTVAPAAPVTVTAVSLSQPRRAAFLMAPLPVTLASLTGFAPPAKAPPYVLPGTVGYLGSSSALTPYSPPGSGLPGAGNTPAGNWTWEPYGMRSFDSSVTLDHVQVYGCVYTASASTVTVTSSVLQAGTGTEFSAIQAGTAAVTVSDSTLGWLPGHMPAAGLDTAPVFTSGVQTVTRCDISGGPQGLDPSASGSVITNCWIHGIVQNSPPANPSHLDGIFVMSGNVTITGCYIDAPLVTTTAAVFFQVNGGNTGVPGCSVTGCYLSGGAFTLFNESATGLVVTGCTFAGGEFGDAANVQSGTIGTWAGNTHPDGSPVPSP